MACPSWKLVLFVEPSFSQPMDIDFDELDDELHVKDPDPQDRQRWPRLFDPAIVKPDSAARAEVERAVLSGTASYALLDGHVRLSRSNGVGVSCWTSGLGECGDRRCGCFRLSRPEVRRRFRHFVAALSDEQMSQRSRMSVRYMTVGCGQLLADFEIMCDLRSRGYTIESVVAVDTAYEPMLDDVDLEAVRRREQSSLLGGGCTTSKATEPFSKAAEQLATFFNEAKVFAFGSLEAYESARKSAPGLYGGCDIFVHCDAAAIPRERIRALSGIALAHDGMAFQLHNQSTDDEDNGAHGKPDPGGDADDVRKQQRKHFRYLLRSASATSCWAKRTRPGTLKGYVLEDVRDSRGDEDKEAAAKRRAKASTFLNTTQRNRAFETGQRLFAVDHRRVAVRDGPSRTASIIGARAAGDEVIASTGTDVDGWIKLSEDGDYWGFEVESRGRETDAWMLVDGAELGLGVLLRHVEVSQPVDVLGDVPHDNSVDEDEAQAGAPGPAPGDEDWAWG